MMVVITGTAGAATGIAIAHENQRRIVSGIGAWGRTGSIGAGRALG